MALIWAENSKAIKKKVGCLIVKDNKIISDGYNGTPGGFNNQCEHIRTNSKEPLQTKPEVLHAESNAITKLARSTMSSDESTLFTTLSPCFECSKLIIQAGIIQVFWYENHNNEGLNLLKKAKIEITQIKKEEL